MKNKRPIRRSKSRTAIKPVSQRKMYSPRLKPLKVVATRRQTKANSSQRRRKLWLLKASLMRTKSRKPLGKNLMLQMRSTTMMMMRKIKKLEPQRRRPRLKMTMPMLKMIRKMPQLITEKWPSNKKMKMSQCPRSSRQPTRVSLRVATRKASRMKARQMTTTKQQLSMVRKKKSPLTNELDVTTQTTNNSGPVYYCLEATELVCC